MVIPFILHNPSLFSLKQDKKLTKEGIDMLMAFVYDVTQNITDILCVACYIMNFKLCVFYIHVKIVVVFSYVIFL